VNLLAVFGLAEPERTARVREARMAALLLFGSRHALTAALADAIADPAALSTYLSAERDRQSAALELLRLQGRDVPRNCRAIIVENAARCIGLQSIGGLDIKAASIAKANKNAPTAASVQEAEPINPEPSSWYVTAGHPFLFCLA
jgi:hypothetical protein